MYTHNKHCHLVTAHFKSNIYYITLHCTTLHYIILYYIHGTAIERRMPQSLAPYGVSAMATRSDKMNYRSNRDPRDVRTESAVTGSKGLVRGLGMWPETDWSDGAVPTSARRRWRKYLWWTKPYHVESQFNREFGCTIPMADIQQRVVPLCSSLLRWFRIARFIGISWTDSWGWLQTHSPPNVFCLKWEMTSNSTNLVIVTDNFFSRLNSITAYLNFEEIQNTLMTKRITCPAIRFIRRGYMSDLHECPNNHQSIN